MKIFSAPSPSLVTENNKESTKSSIRKNKVGLKVKERQPLGKEEIKRKLDNYLEQEGVEKELRIKNSNKLGEGFLKSNAKELMIGDVGKNDPRDTNTQEKLKSVLSKGAFSFNQNEKAVLEKILE